MVREDNPAGRLYKLLLEAKSMSRDTQLVRVWAIVFGVSEDNLPMIYGNLIRLTASLSDIERAIQLQDVDPDIYLQYFPKVRTLLSQPNLYSPLSQHLDSLGEEVLTTIQFCSDRLSKSVPEPTVPLIGLESIREEIERLSTQLEESTLNKNLKAILLDLVESMRQAIAEFRIRGPNGLRQELFHILERLQRSIPLLSENKERPEVQSFWDILGRYDTLASIAVNAPAILSGFQKMLQNTPLA